jgi:hypothetical protein
MFVIIKTSNSSPKLAEIIETWLKNISKYNEFPPLLLDVQESPVLEKNDKEG